MTGTPDVHAPADPNPASADVPSPADPGVVLDVWADLVCPWCYLGMRRLDRARRATAERGITTTVRWRAFELQPGLPVPSMAAEEFFAAKFGGPAQREQIFARVREAGATEGIAFDFAGMSVAPNTVRAHQLVAIAREGVDRGEVPPGTVDAVVAALFAAHFEAGRDLADPVLLDEIARAHGLGAAAGYVLANAALESVRHDEQVAAELGVTGVPFVVADMRLAVSGAQAPETFVALIEQAARSDAA